MKKINLNSLSDIVSILGIISILIAILGFRQSVQEQQKNLAIQAIGVGLQKDFTDAFGYVLAGKRTMESGEEPKEIAAFWGNFNFVSSVLDNIAILYLQDLTDREIIEAMVKDQFMQIQEVYDVLIPSVDDEKGKQALKNGRKNIDLAILKMNEK